MDTASGQAPICPLITPRDGHCWRCGDPLPKRRRRWCSDACGRWYGDQHHWTSARKLVRRRDKWSCQHCGIRPKRGGIEVNHIVPRNGGGYLFGCWNHHDNLETLCHDCHVRVTNLQRKEGRSAASPPDIPNKRQ
ncbi:MAG: HNH endonuclease [Chloroflexi bacterium]|nr:HNH endonuclease [Chloroflexota bacterium]